MKKFAKTHFGAGIMALVSCTIWALHNVLSRGIHDKFQPVEMSFWRWVVAFLVLLPLVRKNFRKNFAILKRDPRLNIWIALLVHVTYNTFFYAASHFTSANNLSLLTTTSFIWTITLGALFGIEKVTGKKIFGAVLAMIGVLVVVLKADIQNLINFQFNAGDIILITGCFCWGIYSLLIKRKHAEMDQLFMLFANVTFGLIMLAPLYIVELHYTHANPFTPEKLEFFAFVGIFGSVVSWSFFNNSVHVLGPVNTSMIFFLLPVMTSFMAYFLISEKLHYYHVISFGLIVFGILMSNLNWKKNIAIEVV